MRGRAVAYLIFAGCALVAWFGSFLVCFSGSPGDRQCGLFLLVVFGLGAITLPIVWSLQRRDPA
ncbi:MAG TPA: hypothetical protein VFW33_13125 [Gemmataceae bacterium]|nr:hypothetical protein [Gemmataceae bacterium]